MQVDGDNAMKKTAVYKWVKRFSEGRESVTTKAISGWPEATSGLKVLVKFDVTVIYLTPTSLAASDRTTHC